MFFKRKNRFRSAVRNSGLKSDDRRVAWVGQFQLM